MVGARLMKKLIALAAVGLVAVVLWIWGRPAYLANKEKKFAAQAREALATNDFRRALLSARQVLALNSNNVIACRVMADIADSARSPHALVWRKRVAELDPALENQIALASCALRYEKPPFALASQVVQRLSAKASNTVAFHLISAQLALKQNRLTAAEEHFKEAGRLEPTNHLHRLNLAVVRLQSPDASSVAEAKAELESLQTNPQIAEHALRSLAVHHLRRKEFAVAQEFSTRLLNHPRASFLDKLEHLTILHSAKEPGFDAFLIVLERQASTNALLASELGSRLVALGEPERALDWLKNLPADIRDQQPVPMAIANAYAAHKDWRGQENFLNDQKWKEQEFLRLALLAHAVRQQKDESVAGVHWEKAVQLASERPELLASLAQTAGSWGWRSEAEDLLWRVAKLYPDERWALDALHGTYTHERQARGLLEVYATVMERDDATNVLVQNNYASLSLLLGTNTARAHELAERVYRAAPENPAFASTYAWSLHIQGKTEEALKIMDQFGPHLSHPNLAAYYGAMLAAAGQKEKAREYLAKATDAAMFPEEKTMVAEALKKL